MMRKTTVGADTRGGELRRILAAVRRRWRARILLRGASLVVGAGIVAFLGSAYGVEWFRFSATAVTTFRWIAWGTVLALVGWFLVRPMLRRVSDEQVALYLEEHEPRLQATILGAVAARDAAADPDAAASPAMIDRLVDRAIEQARTVEEGRAIEQEALVRNGGVFAALTVAAVIALLFGPSTLRTGVSALLPTRAAADVNPYSIAIDPGDLTVARGSDQFITAVLEGFASDEVSIFTRGGESEPFQRLSMIPASSDPEGVVPFEVMLLNLQSDTEYFVESDGVRSPTHTITVRDLPYVDRMQHEYRYPSYTGLEPRVIEDAGDIAVLRGTEVQLTIQPTIPAPSGRIVVDQGESIELSVAPDGSLVGTLPVTAEGFYSVELALDDGTLVEASPQYTIDLLTDARPLVRFETPGRDSQASPIEEVYLEIEADDDYGVRELLLAYRVNGGVEDTVAVFRDSGPPLTEVTAGHTLYLEDYEVEPGDVISYYAVARDQQGPVAEVKSDIYFVTVRPFDVAFREGEEQGGGAPQGGGGGGEMGEERLSELQRQVVAATFNLERDRDRYDETEFEESTTAVALAQGRVREQVATLVTRMTNRGLTEAEADFREIAEMLPEAMAVMDSAEAKLRAQEVTEALPLEQQALRVLQKAEESYEVYVTRQQAGGGGGGGGAQANAEDLADLFELELDKLRNQYETVQRGERQQQANEVDEVRERLEELARRQQQEAERQRARAAQGQQGGGAGAQSQRELADQTEETARQLERLARDTNDEQLQETARQLQEAADAMRRSAAQGGNAGAAESARAQERLAEAQRRLERSRESRVGEDAQNALDRLDRLRDQQQQITDQVSQMSDDPTERGELVQRLQERKTEMAREVGELERDLDRLAADARQEDPAAARELNEAAEAIRSTRLNQKILWSRGVVQQRERDFARIFEEGLEQDLETIRQQMAEAQEAAAGLAEREGMTDALDQARDLVRGMESLERRLDAPPARTDSLAEDGAGGGEPGRLGDRPGEQGEGQQGQGQQGEGQQGQGQQGEQGEGQQGQQGQGQQGEGQQGQGQQGEGQQGQQGQGQQGEGQQGQGQGQQGEGQQGQGQQGQQGQGQQGGGQQGGVAGQSNPDGSPSRAGSMTGGATRGNPIRNYTEEEIRQFAREFQERFRQGTELREALREGGQDVVDLDAALEAMRQLQDVDNYSDLPQIAALREIVRENLGRVEFSLRRMVEGESTGRAAIRGSDAVPPGFEDLVEEYYRNLARSGTGGGGR
ncbi:hypothetical protein [Gaopeijia maritima]|uniref:DUF4175 family protein n=1 Tax=Gaopeijia maritima TaxID=3119007 RepID=A0ABU9E9D0_9BACT